MKRKTIQKAAAIALSAALIAAPIASFAGESDSLTQSGSTSFISQIGQWVREKLQQLGQMPSQGNDFFSGMEGESEAGTPQTQGKTPGQMGGMHGQMGGMHGQMGGAQLADEPTEIQTSTLASNSAEKLTADYSNAQTIVVSETDSQVTISKAGTYIITGSASDGNIKVKKGTTGVVLILKDLTLTSTTGATLSLNKGTEVKVIVEGAVTLTDGENTADEELDTYDGAALKAKAGSAVVLTGTGTLNVNGSAEHGIKVSGTDADDIADGYGDASFIIDGSLTINVSAAEDGINSGTDLTIKNGTVNVSAGDDGIKADYILTIGEESGDGPVIKVSKSEEGLEGAVVNIYSGTIDVTSSDDGINAANSDLSGYTFSINILGGTINVSAGADGLDSNGNLNITGGLTTIVKAASNGGEGGMDYEGTAYVKDGCLVNPFGTTMDSGMGGFGGKQGQMGGGFGQQPDGTSGATPQMPPMGGHGHGPKDQNGSLPEEPQN